MKYFSIVALILTTSGCVTVSYPQSPSELRSYAKQSSLFKNQQYVVSRSAQAVAATFRERVKNCLNFSNRTTITRIGGSPGTGTNAQINNNYRSRVTSTGDLTTLVIEHNNPANIGSPGWYHYLLADVEPIGTNQARVIVTAAIGNAAFTQAIQSWANGNTTPCPGT